VNVRLLVSEPDRFGPACWNAVIAGKRVLSNGLVRAGINALTRFEHDVLIQPAVTHVVFMEGLTTSRQARENPTPAAEDIIIGPSRSWVANARGLKIYGGTLTPYYGASHYSQVGEQKRRGLNEWIHTGNAYDGVVRFGRATPLSGRSQELQRRIRLVLPSASQRRREGSGRLRGSCAVPKRADANEEIARHEIAFTASLARSSACDTDRSTLNAIFVSPHDSLRYLLRDWGMECTLGKDL
jgi:hypothetical protein